MVIWGRGRGGAGWTVGGGGGGEKIGGDRQSDGLG